MTILFHEVSTRVAGAGSRWFGPRPRGFGRGPRWLSLVLCVCAGLLCVCAGLLGLAGVGAARGQVLAQKNWAGSGVTVELWWRRAVFYRIDPSKFQDSTGEGRGDLAGITERLDYLQSLGVDALIVKSTSEGRPAKLTLAPEGLDGLVRAAVGRHLRVLVELGAPASQQADVQYLAMARAWLNQGAAGLYVPTRALEQVDGAEHIALLLQQLRALTNSFPGQRVLLADAPEEQDRVLVDALAKDAQLTASPPIGSAREGAVTAATLRAEWMADLGDTAGGAVVAAARTSQRRRGRAMDGANNPLLVAVRVPAARVPAVQGAEARDGAEKLGLERSLALMLLASRSAVLLEYGQELGLDLAGKSAPLMQWTPTNLSRKPPPTVEPPAPKAETRSAYAGFLPYVRPLPRNFFTPPEMPVVVESFEPPPVDVALLPGFTAGEIDAALAAPNGAAANVALETYEPGSLLNLYKQLIQLHHDNATVRSGSQTVLDRDAEDALVWVRRPPANSRTSSTVVVGCNLSDKPVVLGDFGEVRLGGVRSLLSPAVGELLTVGPYGVMVGETR